MQDEKEDQKPEISDLIASLGEETARSEQLLGILIRATQSRSYMGPIPPPEMLAGYEEVLPGSANRILEMAEKQSQHRMSLEKTVTESDVKRANNGLVMAFGLSIISLAAAAYLAINGHEATASVIVGTNLAALAGSFIYGSIARKNERSEKRQKLLLGQSEAEKKEK